MLPPNSTGTLIPLSSTDTGNTDKLDAAGHSILRLIGKAVGITEEYTQDVVKAAEKVARELRAARDHIAELENELAASRDGRTAPNNGLIGSTKRLTNNLSSSRRR